MCILRQLSHNVNPPLRNHAERPGKRHVGKDLEGVGGRSRYPLATLTPYNPGVGAKYPVDPGRFGGLPATKTSTAWDIQEILQEFTMNRQIGLGIALSLPLAITAWGCNGDQIESGVKTTGTKLEKAGGAIESGTKSLGEKIKETGTGSKLEGAASTTGAVIEKGGEKTRDVLDKTGGKLKEVAPAAGKAVDKAGEKLKELKDKAGEKLKELKDEAGPELKELKDKAGQLEKKAGEKLKDLEDKAKDIINKETGKN